MFSTPVSIRRSKSSVSSQFHTPARAKDVIGCKHEVVVPNNDICTPRVETPFAGESWMEGLEDVPPAEDGTDTDSVFADIENCLRRFERVVREDPPRHSDTDSDSDNDPFPSWFPVVEPEPSTDTDSEATDSIIADIDDLARRLGHVDRSRSGAEQNTRSLHSLRPNDVVHARG